MPPLDQGRFVQFHHRSIFGPVIKNLECEIAALRGQQCERFFRWEKKQYAVDGTGAVVVAVIAFDRTIRILRAAMGVVFPAGGAGIFMLAATIGRRKRIMARNLRPHHPGETDEVEKQ